MRRWTASTRPASATRRSGSSTSTGWAWSPATSPPSRVSRSRGPSGGAATLDWRTDFHNLPPDLEPRWPTGGYALLGDDDWSGYRTERAEILDFVRRERITCLASIAGDRHSFLAGVVSAALPPKRFEPL